MPITNDFQLISTSSIIINRDERQRSKIDTGSLRDSIKRNGLISPVVVTRELVLVAGERRLTACRELGHTEIPVRFVEDLSPVELMIIELEENIKRSDLPWQDEVKATAKLHELYCAISPGWSQVQSAEALSISTAYMSAQLRVSRELEDPRIAAATGIMPAYNILSRIDERRIGDAVGAIMEAGEEIFAPAAVAAAPAKVGEKAPAKPPAVTPPVESILNTSFFTWAPQYSGPRFNLIHCDFPYGMNVFGGSMSGRDKWATSAQGKAPYSDSKEDYWNLIACLCDNLDRIMSPQGHLMFWFSMEHYTATLEAFRKQAPSLVFSPFPLVWVKSDNVGILPDSNRGPRRVYETALVAAREDRFIVKPVSNAAYAPTNKEHHPSTKPEPVLKHFFQLFVDENTTLFDPTCGSATALRAAEALGAKRVLGLESDAEHYSNAVSALKLFRTLRAAASLLAKPEPLPST
jgi:ParB/RepB/Spo0J family partition protein